MRELDVAAILSGSDDVPDGHRSGLVAVVGRPNVGKSSLLNAMVGSKVAIVTDVPGTTRNTIRGVVTRADAQVLFLDTPGLTRPRTLLARRLNDLVRSSLAGVDLVCLMVDIADGIGPGDRFLAAEIADLDVPRIAVANKEDLVTDKDGLIPRLDELASLASFDEVVPTSAVTGLNVDHLVDVVVGYLGEGPRLMAPDATSDQADHQVAAEILREKLIGGMRDEVPHSIAVVVDAIRDVEHRPEVLEVEAVVHVERSSQKGIVIGRGGQVLRDAGAAARRELEALFGRKVFLRTHVRVTKDWQRDPKHLNRLGF